MTTMTRNRLILLLLIGSILHIYADTPDIHNLPLQTPYYRANIRYTVTLPMTDEEVEYDVTLSVAPSIQDSLNGYSRYLITYKPQSGTDTEERFALYENGHYYRSEKQQLREYHRDTQPELFDRHQDKRPIQMTGLFTELLPSEIRRTILQLSGDSNTTAATHTDTIVRGIRCHAIDITQYVQKSIARQSLYCFDPTNRQPLYIKIENNPHGSGAQSIEASYQRTDTTTFPLSEISGKNLLDKWEDHTTRQHGKVRYKATSLKGKTAPRFSLPLIGTTGRKQIDPTAEHPLILLFTDTCSHNRFEAYNRIEKIAIQQNIPMYVIFIESNPDDITDDIGELDNLHAQLLYHGSKTALEYGVTEYPTLFIINTDGKISHIQTGYSREKDTLPDPYINNIRQNKTL